MAAAGVHDPPVGPLSNPAVPGLVTHEKAVISMYMSFAALPAPRLLLKVTPSRFTELSVSVEVK